MDKQGRISYAAERFYNRLTLLLNRAALGTNSVQDLGNYTVNSIAELAKYAEAVINYKFAKARHLQDCMDTSVREQIPPKIYEFVDEWPN